MEVTISRFDGSTSGAARPHSAGAVFVHGADAACGVALDRCQAARFGLFPRAINLRGALFLVQTSVWPEHGYFHGAAELKRCCAHLEPAVEEQFYVLPDLVVAFCGKLGRRTAALIIQLCSRTDSGLGFVGMRPWRKRRGQYSTYAPTPRLGAARRDPLGLRDGYGQKHRAPAIGSALLMDERLIAHVRSMFYDGHNPVSRAIYARPPVLGASVTYHCFAHQPEAWTKQGFLNIPPPRLGLG